MSLVFVRTEIQYVYSVCVVGLCFHRADIAGIQLTAVHEHLHDLVVLFEDLLQPEHRLHGDLPPDALGAVAVYGRTWSPVRQVGAL